MDPQLGSQKSVEGILLSGCLLIALFFLLGAFFLTTFSLALTRLGETLSLGSARKLPSRFFYLPLHRSLFKQRSFELLLFSATIGQHLMRLGYAAAAVCLFLSPEIPLHILIAVWVILLIFMLVFGDYFPRFWVMRAPEQALALSAPLASFFLYCTFPIAFVFIKGMKWSVSGEGKEQRSDPLEEMKETILGILQSADVKGKLNSADKKLLESVIRFKDRIVREVMVPRVSLFSLPVTMSVREAATLLVEEGYSRTPVYRETIDNIIGVLMFKDILELYMECETEKKDKNLLNQPIEAMIKSVFYTPETKKVSQLLQEFRTKQMHMAIVVDEYGGTEGVVTIEDILEEIVGDIADEYDIDEETLYTSHPGGSWIVDARMNILDAEDTFDIHIPQEGDYDTIGGYIFHKVGSIPPKGLKIHHEDFDLEILSSTERSIEKVRITPRHSKTMSTT